MKNHVWEKIRTHKFGNIAEWKCEQCLNVLFSSREPETEFGNLYITGFKIDVDKNGDALDVESSYRSKADLSADCNEVICIDVFEM